MKLGFRPLTYLDFDYDSAPQLWIDGHEKNPNAYAEEKVIFYGYDKSSKNISSEECEKILNDFLTKNDPITEKDMIEGEESAWDAGYRIRDELMK